MIFSIGSGIGVSSGKLVCTHYRSLRLHRTPARAGREENSDRGAGGANCVEAGAEPTSEW